jgi:hypothetical protein
MNSTIKNITGMAVVIAMLSSCGKEIKNSPICDDSAKPSVVTNVKVENRSGNSKIIYSVPDDKNLLYVQAEFVPTNGKTAETKASYYEDSLVVTGFADTLEHEVKLYSVTRCGVRSEPVVVKIKPGESPIFKVYKSMVVENFFGGFRISAKNLAQDNIGIVVLSLNKFKEYEVDNYKSVYTSDSNIVAKIRGMDTVTQRLGFYVQDRWGNKTDTLFVNVTPIFETLLDKSKFKPYVLPNDAPQVTNGARLEYAWDNRTGWPYTSFTDQTKGGPTPHMITFDMGVAAKLSYIWIRPFPELNPQQFYFLTTLKKFELYGSTNPSASGALDNTWELLDTYTVVKQSGTGYGKDTDLDRTVAMKGFDFEVRLNAPKVRYLRVRCLENWAGGTAQSINEISVYGDPR